MPTCGVKVAVGVALAALPAALAATFLGGLGGLPQALDLLEHLAAARVLGLPGVALRLQVGALVGAGGLQGDHPFGGLLADAVQLGHGASARLS